MTRGFNEKTSRRMVHDWVGAATPLNPSLMRSACGRAYAFRAAIVETLGMERRCRLCAMYEKPTVSASAEPK